MEKRCHKRENTKRRERETQTTIDNKRLFIVKRKFARFNAGETLVIARLRGGTKRDTHSAASKESHTARAEICFQFLSASKCARFEKSRSRNLFSRIFLAVYCSGELCYCLSKQLLHRNERGVYDGNACFVLPLSHTSHLFLSLS
jgi:hypothetical protein